MRRATIALCTLMMAYWPAAVLGAPNARNNMEIMNRSIAASLERPWSRTCRASSAPTDYCQGLNSEVIVTSVGRTVDASPSSYETIEFYQRTCSAILSGRRGSARFSQPVHGRDLQCCRTAWWGLPEPIFQVSSPVCGPHTMIGYSVNSLGRAPDAGVAGVVER